MWNGFWNLAAVAQSSDYASICLEVIGKGKIVPVLN
jgi:hypothetical protein